VLLPAATSIHEFGSFRLDSAERLLVRAGQPVSLTPKTFDLLVYLVDRAGRLVTKHELMRALWPDSFVEESNLTFTVSVLRKALGDGHEGEPYIQTVPTKGYRFTAKVRVIPPADQVGAAPPEQRQSGRRPMRWPARGRTKWFVAIAGASVLALSFYVVFRTSTSRPPPIAVPLTAHDGFALSPSISPDGSKVAFSWTKGGPGSSRFIYVKPVGPGEAQPVTRNPGSDFAPAWSPDGRRLAFIRFTVSSVTEDLLVVPAQGGEERRLATMTLPDSPPWAARDIAWTPDGKWIAIGGQPTQDESGASG
jgi:DNA-binding winged helix-turn-helix (wHTH) protein